MSAQVVCQINDLDAGEAMRVEMLRGDDDVLEIAIVRDEFGDWHAIDDECTHGQVSLSDGDVDGRTIMCWLHGSEFDLVTGEALCLPATIPVNVYPVTIEGENVLVDIDLPVNAEEK